MAEPYPSNETESEPPREGGAAEGSTEPLSVVHVHTERPQLFEQPASRGAVWRASHRVVLEGLEAVAVGLRLRGPRVVGLLLTGLAVFLLGVLSTFVLGVPLPGRSPSRLPSRPQSSSGADPRATRTRSFRRGSVGRFLRVTAPM